MKTAKAPVAGSAPHRRSQPVRQTRTNPPRTSSGLGRSAGGRDSLAGAHAPDQPIDIFPATTHFADAVTALPKELVRHFTLLREVEAKIFGPEEAVFKLVDAALNAPILEPRPSNDASSSVAPASAPMSTQNSSSGVVLNNSVQPVPSSESPYSTVVFDPSNIPRRHLFRQTAVKIKEMLGSLEEKNHVITTANEALQKHLGRIEDIWPHLENEFSDEAKWGSTAHWAYPENRVSRTGHIERQRRDGANAISAAAQALADEAAARSDARKQAVMAKKNLKNQHQESEHDDQEARSKGDTGKKAHNTSKVRKAADATTNVGLGISNAAPANGNPPPKRRKVDKTANGAAPAERAMSTVFGNSAPKQKTTSPRETPAPDVPKKRKALPTSNGQAKKSKNGVSGMSPSVTSSPVLGSFPDIKPPGRSSPVPAGSARPVSSRARQNSTQSNVENPKARPSSSASNIPNGVAPATPDIAAPSTWSKPAPEPKPAKEAAAGAAKPDAPKKDSELVEATPGGGTSGTKKESRAEDGERKNDSLPPVQTATATVTKSGRASKPSTPALATFQEAARPRSSRHAETTTNKRTKKTSAVAQTIAAQLADEDGNSSLQGDDDEGEAPDPDEPTFCYCNSVSYGEMIACDADGCEREWFHLECVGLKVAPKGNAKWFCEDCKERLKAGGKKVNGR